MEVGTRNVELFHVLRTNGLNRSPFTIYDLNDFNGFNDLTNNAVRYAPGD